MVIFKFILKFLLENIQCKNMQKSNNFGNLKKTKRVKNYDMKKIDVSMDVIFSIKY